MAGVTTMTAENTPTDYMAHEFNILDVKELHLPVHLVSDLDYWEDWFQRLAAVNSEHDRVLTEFVNTTQQYLDKLNMAHTQQPDEESFYGDIQIVQASYRIKAAHLREDAHKLHTIVDNMKTYKESSSAGKLDLECVDRHYKTATDNLQSHIELINKSKKAYHKAVFKKEKSLVKVRMATQTQELHKVEKKLQLQTEKVGKLLNEYRTELTTWQEEIQDVQKRSDRYEAAFLAQQDDSAKMVLASLRNCVELTNVKTGHRDVMFEDMNCQIILEDTVIKKQHLTAPVFEEYKPSGCIKDMFEKAKSDVKSQEMSELEMNRKLKSLMDWVYTVTEERKQQNIDELDLSIGDRVRQILPPDDAGVAYGEITCGVLNKRKRGFYPVSCTTCTSKGDKTQKKSRKVKTSKMNYRKNRDNNEFSGVIREGIDDVTELNVVKKKRKFFSKENILKKLYGVHLEVDDFDFGNSHCKKYISDTTESNIDVIEVCNGVQIEDQFDGNAFCFEHIGNGNSNKDPQAVDKVQELDDLEVEEIE